MPSGFSLTRRVEFRDTDAAGIAHFSVFFVWMEQAEHAALRALGVSVLPTPDTADEMVITWPRVSAHCDYRSPAFFEDELQVDVRITKLGEKSVTYGFVFHAGERMVAEGSLTTVCCLRSQDGELASTAIPPALRQTLERLC